MAARRLATQATLLAALASVLGAGTASASTGLPGRAGDPVVLRGSATPLLLGSAPGRIVAFGYDGGWEQVPVQVDERAVVDYGVVRQMTGDGFDHEAYTDPGTYAGPDPDPALDEGDEIALMAKDAGEPAADAASPAHVVAATRTRVAITDPLEPGAPRAVYLFRSDGALDPAAGRSYVAYDFALDSGPYKTTYDFNGVADVEADAPPANPESSTVTTPAYTQHLLSRWVTDGLTLQAGSAPATDLLDGDKVQVSRGCSRSELTFSRGGGGFIANISGPVRAIRSQIGANSGTYTQRDDIFYGSRQDTFTYLRVHAGIYQVSQFRDYSTAATGMTYRSSAYPAGVTIDGVPDAGIPVPPGATTLQPQADWEQVTGPEGSIVTVNRIDTDLPGYTPGSFYRDQGSSPTFGQCGGYADHLSYGTSGTEFLSGGANTDPTRGAAYHLTGTRTTYFDAPNGSAAGAELRSAQVDSPLEVAVSGEPEPADPALAITAGGARRQVSPGGSVRIPVRVRNTGGSVATGVEVCARVPERVAVAGRCKGTKLLAVDDGRRFELRISVRRDARRRVRVTCRVTADNARRDKVEATIRVRR